MSLKIVAKVHAETAEAVLAASVPDHAVAIVNLGGIRHNFSVLKEVAGAAQQLAPALKANAYGLGMAPIASVLSEEGANRFFVAHVSEAVTLRAHLPFATIAVLHGLVTRNVEEAVRLKLTPVISTLEQMRLWLAAAERAGEKLPAMLHVNTGMSRLGLMESDVVQLAADTAWHGRLNILGLMSHLASADEPEKEQNQQQLARFLAAAKRLPPMPLSLANSPGLFLGRDYHFDFARPGKALYGHFVSPLQSPRLRPAVSFYAPILQVAEMAAGESVGYNATFKAPHAMRVATLAVGYADGLRRHLSNTGKLFVAGVACPVVGRISMDLTVIDVSAVPAESVCIGQWAEVFGPHQPLFDVANDARTNCYELLTSLTNRVELVYVA
ncbi:MAG: alanine racemase [Alphaproteobacteria bacterium]|nr:alanine racemase [Alphaproteobacteria bacterium]